MTFYAFDECFVQLFERCNMYVAILKDNSKENKNILLILYVSVLADQAPELYWLTLYTRDQQLYGKHAISNSRQC